MGFKKKSLMMDLTSSSKYEPHQGKREKERRVKHIEKLKEKK